MTEFPFRRIESSVPQRYPRGWHCLGPAAAVAAGRPMKIDAFGTRLVAYRGEGSGTIRVLDAYCPHMGGDLSDGRVIGETLACPFHGWQWGQGGRCEHIPYCATIPAAARIREWPSCVQNELLFVWHDTQGLPPLASEAIPLHRSTTDPRWTRWNFIRLEVHGGGREVVDNMADCAHFSMVHKAPAHTFANLVDGHRFWQLQGAGNFSMGVDSLRSVSVHHGPAHAVSDIVSPWNGVELEFVFALGLVPITQERLTIHAGIKVRTIESLSFAANQHLADGIAASIHETLDQDVPIWSNKRRVNNPVLCKSDGPTWLLRRWYEQFLVDREQVEPAHVAKKLHVTCHAAPAAAWIREIFAMDWHPPTEASGDATQDAAARRV